MEHIHSRSVGGIVIGDGGTVAMVRRRNSNGSWLFPKGHPERDETDEEAARREIEEEAGLTNLEYIDDLGSYERHPILPNGNADLYEIKEIHMFLFAASGGSKPNPSNEMVGAEWVPLAHVVEVCGNAADAAWFSRIFERVRHAVQRD